MPVVTIRSGTNYTLAKLNKPLLRWKLKSIVYMAHFS